VRAVLERASARETAARVAAGHGRAQVVTLSLSLSLSLSLARAHSLSRGSLAST
jgi:chorismate synthase